MSKGARSVLIFGIYLAFLGGTLIVVPNLLLAAFSVPLTKEIWIRIVGTLLVGISFFYIQAVRAEFTAFFRWTVYARIGVFVSFVCFVVLGLAPSTLILFGLVDLTGAVWTAKSLRSETPATVPV